MGLSTDENRSLVGIAKSAAKMLANQLTGEADYWARFAPRQESAGYPEAVAGMDGPARMRWAAATLEDGPPDLDAPQSEDFEAAKVREELRSTTAELEAARQEFEEQTALIEELIHSRQDLEDERDTLRQELEDVRGDRDRATVRAQTWHDKCVSLRNTVANLEADALKALPIELEEVRKSLKALRGFARSTAGGAPAMVYRHARQLRELLDALEQWGAKGAA